MSSLAQYQPSSGDLEQRFAVLDGMLAELAPLWRPQPFKEARPGWCAKYPELTAALLALSDQALSELQSDDVRLSEWLVRFIPDIERLLSLSSLADIDAEKLEVSRHMEWAVPGRKWQQITAFAAAMGPAKGPVLEWCGGKGHLGRLLGAGWDVPVTTLEHNSQLCEEGGHLAQRARVNQSFHTVDVLSLETPSLSGHHAVALHACGELHRSLIRKAVAQGVHSMDIAPCCYHFGVDDFYRPFNPSAALRLSRDDVRLAVTETVTSRPREVRLRDREMAWKLGFLALLESRNGGGEYLPISPIDKTWLNEDFARFCQFLAEREGVELGVVQDWEQFESRGWQRQGEVMRLSLLRHAVRRPLELWLVLDLALYLQTQGYDIRLGTFCDTPLTPRNILLSARRCDL